MKKIYVLIGKIFTFMDRSIHFFVKQYQLSLFKQVGEMFIWGKVANLLVLFV